MRRYLVFGLVACVALAGALEIGPKSASKAEGDSRPTRGSGVFDAPDDGGETEQQDPAATVDAAEEEEVDKPAEVVTEDDAEVEAAPASGSKATTDVSPPSAEWQAATEGITADMRAHLGRRQKRADADLIKQNRGLIGKVLFGMGDLLRSTYFKNVRKSLSVFFGMWIWYVLNTKTYVPPEFEE